MILGGACYNPNYTLKTENSYLGYLFYSSDFFTFKIVLRMVNVMLCVKHMFFS